MSVFPYSKPASSCSLLFALLAVACGDSLAGDLNSRTIYLASGARSGGDLTTVAHCTNTGSISGRIQAAFYNYNGVFVCTAAALGIAPGATASLSVASIASMANLNTCSAPFSLTQGSVHLFGTNLETLRFRCTVELISRTGDPPVGASRLTLYTSRGALISDVLFADGYDP